MEHGGIKPAAKAMGIGKSRLDVLLWQVRVKVGAVNTVHAVWILFPSLGDRYRLPLTSGEEF